MNFDLSEAWLTVQHLINGFDATLPRLLLAIIVVGVFIGVGKLVRALVRRNAMRRGDRNTLKIRARQPRASHALQQAEDVAPDPGADVILVELAEFTVNLRARWWTKSTMTRRKRLTVTGTGSAKGGRREAGNESFVQCW